MEDQSVAQPSYRRSSGNAPFDKGAANPNAHEHVGVLPLAFSKTALLEKGRGGIQLGRVMVCLDQCLSGSCVPQGSGSATRACDHEVTGPLGPPGPSLYPHHGRKTGDTAEHRASVLVWCQSWFWRDTANVPKVWGNKSYVLAVHGQGHEQSK